MGDPPVFLFEVAEWQARDKMKLGEAELLFGNKPERGIRLVNKPTIQERELGSGLATIEQVEASGERRFNSWDGRRVAQVCDLFGSNGESPGSTRML